MFFVRRATTGLIYMHYVTQSEGGFHKYHADRLIFHHVSALHGVV